MKSLDKGKVRLGKSTAKPFDTKGKIRNLDNWKEHYQMEVIKNEFEQSGIIRLNNFFPPNIIFPVQERIYTSFEKRGIRKNGTWQYNDNNFLDLPESEVKLIRKELTKIKELRSFDNDNLLNSVSMISDNRITSPKGEQKGPWQILITLPNTTKWVVPHLMWHLDFPRLPNNQLPGVQMFTFLDSVKPQGGGTLVVSGSHQLLNNQRVTSSKEVKKTLEREEKYFTRLFSSQVENREKLLLENGQAGEVNLRIIELTGEPGDLLFSGLAITTYSCSKCLEQTKAAAKTFGHPDMMLVPVVGTQASWHQ